MKKHKDIYLYIDTCNNKALIGKRGGFEYQVDLREFNSYILRARLDGDDIPQELFFEKAYEYAKKESQYVEFEELNEEPKKLN